MYSILEMSHPTVRLSLKSDYTKSLTQVFKQAVVADTMDGGNLEALRLVDHGGMPPADFLQSWVA